MTHDDMAHLNRRSTDEDDGKRHRVLEAVESTQAKFIARMVTPALLSALLGMLVWVGKDVPGDIAQLKSDMRVLATRFDEVALRQVQSNTDRLEQVEKKNIDQDSRIDALERTVKTP